MKLYINPQSEGALTSAPSSNDLIFDLPGRQIYTHGTRFSGLNSTYTFESDDYISISQIPSGENNRVLISLNTHVLGLSLPYLPLTGGTLTGNLTINANNTINGKLYLSSYISTTDNPELLDVARELETAVHYRTVSSATAPSGDSQQQGGGIAEISTNSPTYLTVSGNIINANVTSIDSGNNGLADSKDVKEYVDSKIGIELQIVDETTYNQMTLKANTIYFVY